LKHEVGELTCSLIAQALHPYFIFITEHYLMDQKLF